eukprot:9216975-Ditylum_brightwellii.AAC.1
MEDIIIKGGRTLALDDEVTEILMTCTYGVKSHVQFPKMKRGTHQHGNYLRSAFLLFLLILTVLPLLAVLYDTKMYPVDETKKLLSKKD